MNCYHQYTPPPLPGPRPLEGWGAERANVPASLGGEPSELAVVINSPPIVGEG